MSLCSPNSWRLARGSDQRLTIGSVEKKGWLEDKERRRQVAHYFWHLESLLTPTIYPALSDSNRVQPSNLFALRWKVEAQTKNTNKQINNTQTTEQWILHSFLKMYQQHYLVNDPVATSLYVGRIFLFLCSSFFVPHWLINLLIKLPLQCSAIGKFVQKFYTIRWHYGWIWGGK